MRDLVRGFIAGALAVVAFHQGMVFLLSTVGLLQSHVYAMRGVPPFGVPTILNQLFWGGLWGLRFAAIAATLPHWPLLLLGCGLGVLGPVLASWFVVAPLKGTPIAAGWGPLRMLASLLINGCWGIGVALLYAGLRRWASGHSGITGLLLRLTLAVVMFPHGAQKALGWFGGQGFEQTLASFTRSGIPMGLVLLVIGTELLGPLGLAVGLLPRVVAFGLICERLVAIIRVQWRHGFFMNWTGTQPGLSGVGL